ncbi:MAG: hypothetical protein QG608_3505 [Actinomycetota bacterium]|nr:hypothetical protein [Actinomycetota bacterium]
MVDEGLFEGGRVGQDVGEGLGEVGEVFAGVVVVHDLGGGQELLVGDGPDPFGAVAEDDGLADLVEPAAVVLGLDVDGEGGGGFEGGDVAGRAGVLDGVAGVGVAAGLSKQAADLDFPGSGPSTVLGGVLAGAAGAFAGQHRGAGAVQDEVAQVRALGAGPGDRAGRGVFGVLGGDQVAGPPALGTGGAGQGGGGGQVQTGQVAMNRREGSYGISAPARAQARARPGDRLVPATPRRWSSGAKPRLQVAQW